MTIQKVNLIFRALADETRLRILHLLKLKRELCVCEFIAILKMGQSKVSRHLSHLKKAGLVQVRKQGLWSYYALSKPNGKFHSQMIHCLDKCFNQVPVLKKDSAALKNSRACK